EGRLGALAGFPGAPGARGGEQVEREQEELVEDEDGKQRAVPLEQAAGAGARARRGRRRMERVAERVAIDLPAGDLEAVPAEHADDVLDGDLSRRRRMAQDKARAPTPREGRVLLDSGEGAAVRGLELALDARRGLAVRQA